MSKARIVLVCVAAVAAGIQFVRPARTNPPAIDALAIADPDVAAVLHRACFDCHSNETAWPWYSEIAPISWLVVDHVNDGRRHMNFSVWSAPKAAKHVGGVCEEARSGSMPLRSYTLAHRDAALDRDEVERLCRWAALEEQSMETRLAEKQTNGTE